MTQTQLFIVTRYDELPTELDTPEEYTTILEARRAVRRHLIRVPDRDLAGQRYDDGTVHVEAYYDDRYRSSGYWISVKHIDADDTITEAR